MVQAKKSVEVSDMSDKKKKEMILLIGVFVILLICYLGIHMYAEKQEAKKEEEAMANTIYMTEVTDVTAVSYDGGTDVMTFQKDADGAWYSADDEAFPLNPDTVESIVSTFGKLEAERKLTDGDAISAYGLDAPTYYVSMTDGDGKKITVNIGNAAEDSYYAMVEGEDMVYTISGDVIADLQTPLTDMAELDEFPAIGSGNIVSEEIKHGDSTVKYEADNEDDTENIATVVGGLGAIALDTPVDYHMADTDQSKYGFDETNRTTVTVCYNENDTEQTVVLYLGNEDGSGSRYVQLKESKIVYTVSTAICDNILNVPDEAEE